MPHPATNMPTNLPTEPLSELCQCQGSGPQSHGTCPPAGPPLISSDPGGAGEAATASSSAGEAAYCKDGL